MPEYSLGIAATCYLIVWQTIDTLEFLERCHRFGAAGIHAVINNDPLSLRRRCEQLDMYFEAMVALPVGPDTSEFEQSLKDAQAAGATALRAACLSTRRYETFQDMDAWQRHVAISHRSLEAAMPLLDQYKIPLGLENHKDWTTPELLALLKRFESEYFGVCLDFGNNLSLLEPPMETIERLAPYAVTTHLKDIAVSLDGPDILMSEVVLGQGVIDIPRAVHLIRQARPRTRMNLEMITRDPLKIPISSSSYGATFPPGSADTAAARSFVRKHQTSIHLPRSEDQNIADCLASWRAMGL